MDEQRKPKSSMKNNAGLCAALGVTLLLLGVGGYFLLRDPHPAASSTPMPETTVGEENSAAARRAEHQTPPAPPASGPAQVEAEPEPPATPVARGDAPEPTMPETVPEPMSVPMEEETGAEPAEPTMVVCPLRGQVLAAFSAEELSYNETLGDWRTHEGLDIAANPGDTVLSAAAGTVLSVQDDPMMGTVVTIAHEGGYETSYANLQTEPAVLAGDEVSAGQIIGAVGSTAAAEASQPPHLHFGVKKDGQPMDPEEFLPK